MSECFIVWLYRFWISSYGSDFKKDEQLTALLTEFLKQVECEEEKDIIHCSNL